MDDGNVLCALTFAAGRRMCVLLDSDSGERDVADDCVLSEHVPVNYVTAFYRSRDAAAIACSNWTVHVISIISMAPRRGRRPLPRIRVNVVMDTATSSSSSSVDDTSAGLLHSMHTCHRRICLFGILVTRVDR